MSITTAKKSLEKKDLNQVSGGRISVSEKMAMFEKLNDSQVPLPKKESTPGKIDIGERYMSFDAAKSNVANAKTKDGKPIIVAVR